jgi:hypothetical protein
VFPFKLTDHVRPLGIPFSVNITAYVSRVNVTETGGGAAPSTVTVPAYALARQPATFETL